jgi:probable F420-dependent oxidoreductase
MLLRHPLPRDSAVRVGIALIEGYSFSRDPVQLGIAGIAAAARKIEALGFDDIISAETAGHDPFFPLLIAAEHTERIQLGTGIAVSFPRSPMVVAQMAWDLQRFSGGRFRLGLGPQVKRHNERRFGVPWTGPAGPRMREYVQCLRAIFETFQNPEQPRHYRGEHYQFSMLPPVFRPEPIAHPDIPIHVAALNPVMCRLAGELCDGIFAHPVCTARYLREVMLPAVAAGAREARRSLSDIDVVGAPIVVTGRDEAEMTAERQLLKSSRSTAGGSWAWSSTRCRSRTAGTRWLR